MDVVDTKVCPVLAVVGVRRRVDQTTAVVWAAGICAAAEECEVGSVPVWLHRCGRRMSDG